MMLQYVIMMLQYFTYTLLLVSMGLMLQYVTQTSLLVSEDVNLYVTVYYIDLITLYGSFLPLQE